VFKRVFNSYFYGKSGKGDFEKDDLPRNRWQLFWEMFRIRFTSFFKLNIIALPFFLPTLVVIVLIINSLLGYGAILQQVQEGADTVTPEMLALVDGDMENLYGLILSGLIWLIPAITISGPGQAGLAYVTRNWARDEHAFVFSDFKDAVKENWKQSLLFSLITSLLPADLFLGWVFLRADGAKQLDLVNPQILPAFCRPSLVVDFMLCISYVGYLSVALYGCAAQQPAHGCGQAASNRWYSLGGFNSHDNLCCGEPVYALLPVCPHVPWRLLSFDGVRCFQVPLCVGVQCRL
jgi:hypothetical protein